MSSVGPRTFLTAIMRLVAHQRSNSSRPVPGGSQPGVNNSQLDELLASSISVIDKLEALVNDYAQTFPVEVPVEVPKTAVRVEHVFRSEDGPRTGDAGYHSSNPS